MHNQVCELCLLRPATRHLSEAPIRGGVAERHLCDGCYESLSGAQGPDDSRSISDYTCQLCGAPAKIIDGVGPRQKTMCYACAQAAY